MWYYGFTVPLCLDSFCHKLKKYLRFQLDLGDGNYKTALGFFPSVDQYKLSVGFSCHAQFSQLLFVLSLPVLGQQSNYMNFQLRFADIKLVVCVQNSLIDKKNSLNLIKSVIRIFMFFLFFFFLIKLIKEMLFSLIHPGSHLLWG
jgi:hypothetical protein